MSDFILPNRINMAIRSMLLRQKLAVSCFQIDERNIRINFRETVYILPYERMNDVQKHCDELHKVGPGFLALVKHPDEFIVYLGENAYFHIVQHENWDRWARDLNSPNLQYHEVMQLVALNALPRLEDDNCLTEANEDTVAEDANYSIFRPLA